MPKKLKFILGIIAAFSFICVSLIAQDMDAVQTVKGVYTQKNYIAKTGKTLVSSGDFVLSREHGIIWYTLKPQKSVTVMTEQKVIQVFSSGKEKLMGDSGNPIFSLVAKLTKSLFTQDAVAICEYLHEKQSGSRSWIYVPKDNTLLSVIKEIQLVNADNGYIESVSIKYGNGDISEYMLFVAAINASLTKDEKAYFEK